MKTAEGSSGQTHVTELEVPAFGVYDPEKQLSPAEIEAMKAEINKDDILRINIVVHIVEGILRDYSELYKDQSPEELLTSVTYLSGNWGVTLGQALTLPGSEWPQDVTPPATFAEALKEVKQKQAQEDQSI